MYIYPLLLEELVLLLASHKVFSSVNNFNRVVFKINEETTKAMKEDLIPKLKVANHNWYFSTM